jgi:ribosome-associated heat shock protein Hsp15
MRLDKFLFFIRITKTRSLAQKIIQDGHVRLDGETVQKACATIAVGQVITLPLGSYVRIIRVRSLPVRRGPAAEAQSHYDDPRQKSRLTQAAGDSNAQVTQVEEHIQ